MSDRRSFLAQILAAPVALLTNGLGRGVQPGANVLGPALFSQLPHGTGAHWSWPIHMVADDYLSDPGYDDEDIDEDDAQPPAPIPPQWTFVCSTAEI